MIAATTHAADKKSATTLPLVPKDYWVTQLDITGTGYGIAIDTNGYSYVSGSNESHPFVVKLSPSGQIIWQKTSEATGLGKGIALAGSVGLYTAGYELESEGISAFIARSWQLDGRQIWKKKIGVSNENLASQISVDKQGFIYVGGITTSAISPKHIHHGQSDIFIAKYTPFGQQKWLKQIGSASEDILNSMAVDSDNNLYLFATSNQNLQNFKKWVYKLNTDGYPILQTSIDLHRNAAFVGTAIDKAGHIYILKSTAPEKEHLGSFKIHQYTRNGDSSREIKSLPNTITVMDGIAKTELDHFSRAGFAFSSDVFIYINTYNYQGRLIKHDRFDTAHKWDLVFGFATHGNGKMCITGNTHGMFLETKKTRNFNLLVACKKH